jgi:putative ABC transport system permease protein
MGYALGMGMAATFFAIFVRQIATRGIILLPAVMAGTAVVVVFIVLIASVMSVRKVLVLEPAVVFRG